MPFTSFGFSALFSRCSSIDFQRIFEATNRPCLPVVLGDWKSSGGYADVHEGYLKTGVRNKLKKVAAKKLRIKSFRKEDFLKVIANNYAHHVVLS